MSYRCGVCNNVVPPGQPRRTHAVKRPNGQIEREIPVCPDCNAQLIAGMPLVVLERRHKPAPMTVNSSMESEIELTKPPEHIAKTPAKPVCLKIGNTIVPVNVRRTKPKTN